MACTKIFTACLPSSNKRRCLLRQLDLQLFNQEKTEEATPKRREEARKKGQVAKSAEVSSAFIILAAFFALKLAGPFIFQDLIAFMRFRFSEPAPLDFTIASVQQLFLDTGLVFLKAALPVMMVILIISLAINFLQVGFAFSPEAIKPQFDRINPLSGFQRIFSKRSLVELLKSIGKVVIIGWFIYRFILQETEQAPELIRMDLGQILTVVSSWTLDLAFQLTAVMIILAGFDYFYQWWEHNQSLKMSKQEVKEEMKQTEGDPQIKSKIRERQRAIAMRRMMQEVPKADVVVTNPTHFAVALKYEKNMAAPVVVAKGQDFLAQKIKEIARNHSVAIVENKPLARALYSSADIGQVIPSDLYQAVAEVLAYVYRLKKRLS